RSLRMTGSLRMSPRVARRVMQTLCGGGLVMIVLATTLWWGLSDTSGDPCALLKSLRAGDPNAERRLLDAGLALVPCTDGQSRESPIHVAAELGNVRLLGQLLSRGANPDQRDGHGSAPIR